MVSTAYRSAVESGSGATPLTTFTRRFGFFVAISPITNSAYLSTPRPDDITAALRQDALD